MKEEILKKIEVLAKDAKAFEEIKSILVDFELESKGSFAQKEYLLSYAQKIGKIATFSFDLISRKVEWSKEIYEILERNSNEFDHTAEGFSKFIHPEDIERAKSELSPRNSKESIYSEYRLIMPDGKIKYVLSEGTIEFNNGLPVKFTGLTQDITERKTKEEELKIYKHILKNNWDAVVFADMNGIVRYTNSTADHLYGYEEGELIGQHVHIFNFGDVEQTQEIMDLIVQNGGWSGEIIQKKKDGNSLQALLTVSLVKNDQGKPIGFSSNSKDISEKKFKNGN